MLDRFGNDWQRIDHPIPDERCVEPGCPTRQRLGSERCFDHHRGEPVWNELHQIWIHPERELHWCSVIENRQLVRL